MVLASPLFCLVFGFGVARAEVPTLQTPLTGGPDVPLSSMQQGRWTEPVSIDLPPAPRGTRPSIGLTADHGVADGVLGEGWRLDGFSEIVRRGAGGGVPMWLGDDEYVVDGQQLYMDGGGYKPEIDDGRTFYPRSDGENGWEAIRDGWHWFYGEAQEGGGTVGLCATESLSESAPCDLHAGEAATLDDSYRWLIAAIEDPSGNRITFDYTGVALGGTFGAATAVHVPTSVHYAGGTVVIGFDWAERPDYRSSLRSGGARVQYARLAGITVAGDSGATPLGEWLFHYVDDDAADGMGCVGEAPPVAPDAFRSVLHRIERVDSGATASRELRCATVNYEADGTGFPSGDYADQTLSLGWPDFLVEQLAVFDPDGDGIPALAAGEAAWSWDGSTLADDGPATEIVAAVAGEADKAFVDVDRDGATDVLTATQDTAKLPDLAASWVTRWYLDGSDALMSETVSVDLPPTLYDAAQFADVDGDGFVDLILPARDLPDAALQQWADEEDTLLGGSLYDPVSDSGYGKTTKTLWIKNLGKSPWFESAETAVLATPYEGGDWNADIEDAQAICGEFGPNDEPYAAIWTDLNGDGLADVLYDAYLCAQDYYDDTPTPDAFFRVAYGDGGIGFWEDDQSFPAVEISAGSIHVGRLRLGQRMDGAAGSVSFADLDRDGIAEIIIDSRVYRNEGHGGGFVEAGDAPSGVDTPYLVTDFTGDGFPDFFGWDPDALNYTNSSSGPIDPWAPEQYLHVSDRTVSAGRLTALRGVWGGTEQFTYAPSTASGDNTDLPYVLEVIQSVINAEGTSTYSFSGGSHWEGQFRGFTDAVVERENGSIEQAKFAVAPGYAGALVYDALFRQDQSLARLTNNVYLQDMGTVWSVDTTAPYWNPMRKQCGFEVGPADSSGHQSVTIEDLVDKCTIIGTLAQFAPDLVGVAYGWQYEPSSQDAKQVASAVWGTESIVAPPPGGDPCNGDPNCQPPPPGGDPCNGDPNCTQNPPPPPPGGDPCNGDPNCQPPGSQPPPGGTAPWGGFSGSGGPASWWGLPGLNFGAFEPYYAPLDGTSSDNVPNPVTPTPPTNFGGSVTTVRMTHRSWAYDGDHRVQQSWDRRDSTIPDDDIETQQMWFGWDAGANGKVLQRVEVRNADGDQKETQYQNYVDFDLPQLTTEHSGSEFRTVTRSFDGTGQIQQTVWPDASTESWTYNALGEVLTHTDELFRVETHTYDAAGDELQRTWEGSSITWLRDGYGRPIRQTSVAMAGLPNTPAVIETWDRDDVIDVPDVRGSWSEPRTIHRTADGRMELTYLDPWGRDVMTLSCAESASSTLACEPGTERIAERGYATDGSQRYSTRAYGWDEAAVAATWTYLNAIGELEHTLSPAPDRVASVGDARWVDTEAFYIPGEQTSTDPEGLSCTVSSDTLGSETNCAGAFRGSVSYDAWGRTELQTAGDGTTWQLRYDPFDHLSEKQLVGSIDTDTGPATPTWHYLYDVRGRLFETQDPAGNRTQEFHDNGGRPTQTMFLPAYGAPVSTHTWMWSNYSGASTSRTVQETDVNGAMSQSWLDGAGRAFLTLNPDATGTVRMWDDVGRIDSVTDPDGITRTVTYDVDGRRTKVSGPTGIWERVTAPSGELTTTTDPDGVVIEAVRGWNGQVLESWQGRFLLGAWEYDDDGRVLTSDARGTLAHTTYDALGRPGSRCIDDGFGACLYSTVWGYDDADRVLTETRSSLDAPTPLTWTNSYNPVGWLTDLEAPDATVSSWEYDVLGQPKVAVDPDMHTSQWSYDGFGRVVQEAIPGQGMRSWSYTFGVMGGTETHRFEPDGGDWQTRTDWAGRETESWFPDGTGTRNSYEGTRLRATENLDPTGYAIANTSYGYDSAGRMIWRWAQHDGPFSPSDVPAAWDTVYSYSYTAAGRTESMVGPEGEETDWGYIDGFVDYEDTVGLYTRTYGYDPATAQLTGWQDDNGSSTRTVSLAYTGPELRQRTAGDGATIETQSWGDWDAYGTPRQTSSLVDFTTQAEEVRTTDALGRLTTVDHTIAGSSLGTVSYGYTGNGSLASVDTSWAGGYTLHRGSTGLVDDIRDSSTGVLLARIDGRDPLGRATHAWTADGGQTERDYDTTGRTTWFRVEHGGTVDDRQTSYDMLGRAEHVAHLDGDGAWGQDLVYETPGRLTDDIRRYSTGDWSTHYEWDAAGNRTSISKDGGPATISTYDNADRLLTVGATTLAYDPFGGIIDDGAGFGIPRGADGAEIGVDAISGGTVSPLYTFWRNAGGEPVATEDADGLHREVWGNPGADLPLAGDGPEGNWLWIAADGLVLGQLRDGAVLGAANDPSGSIAYFDGALAGVPGAFGEGAGLSDERHAWTGMETLPGTPYQLAQHRLYDTANGRFTVNDPIGLAGGDHRYAYAGGDPVQFVDPSGLSFAAQSSGSPASHASGDGLHSKQLFDSMYTGMGEDSGYDQWHDYGTYEDFRSADAARADHEMKNPTAEDACQGMGCPQSGSEPGDEQDGTGIPKPIGPVLCADADDEESGADSGPTPSAEVDVYAERLKQDTWNSRTVVIHAHKKWTLRGFLQTIRNWASGPRRAAREVGFNISQFQRSLANNRDRVSADATVAALGGLQRGWSRTYDAWHFTMSPLLVTAQGVDELFDSVAAGLGTDTTTLALALGPGGPVAEETLSVVVSAANVDAIGAMLSVEVEAATKAAKAAGAGGEVATSEALAAGSVESDIVYRALNAADADALLAGRGLTAKAPEGTWTAAEHVANTGPGAGGAAANSPWLSTTRRMDVAQAYDSGNGIVAIDLNRVSSFQTEVWRSAPRLNGVEGLPYHRSIWAQEVTVFQEIPADAIRRTLP